MVRLVPVSIILPLLLALLLPSLGQTEAFDSDYSARQGLELLGKHSPYNLRLIADDDGGYRLPVTLGELYEYLRSLDPEQSPAEQTPQANGKKTFVSSSRLLQQLLTDKLIASSRLIEGDQIQVTWGPLSDPGVCDAKLLPEECRYNNGYLLVERTSVEQPQRRDRLFVILQMASEDAAGYRSIPQYTMISFFNTTTVDSQASPILPFSQVTVSLGRNTQGQVIFAAVQQPSLSRLITLSYAPNQSPAKLPYVEKLAVEGTDWNKSRSKRQVTTQLYTPRLPQPPAGALVISDDNQLAIGFWKEESARHLFHSRFDRLTQAIEHGENHYFDVFDELNDATVLELLKQTPAR